MTKDTTMPQNQPEMPEFLTNDFKIDGSTSSSEISQQIADKERDISEALRLKEVVDQEYLHNARKILELRLVNKDVESAVSKAQHNLRQLEIEKKLLEKRYWKVAKEGR